MNDGGVLVQPHLLEVAEQVNSECVQERSTFKKTSQINSAKEKALEA